MIGVRRDGKRSQKAQETRRRILEAARELFVAQGYGPTSLQDVAARAGVATRTVCFSFGNKHSLLKALVEATITGDEQSSAVMDLPWFREAMATETAAAHLRAHVHGLRLILDRVASIIKVLNAAAAMDPEVAMLWPRDSDPQYTVQWTAAESMMAKPGARPGVSPEYAADLLYSLLSPELYLQFVQERGWSPDRWERWSQDTLRAQLCEDGALPA
ncbi:TetR/AcrR family transcriptional regulator [Nonomuraea sp. NEAU-A123]|nr:TetR/AcrR family transcriptional regulator [Nonomuraea sp. NEAU-A123]